MKVRKLAVALALAGGLGSGVAQALGLGEIELQSYLNQPLNAEIDVNRAGGVSPSDIIVNLASEQAYERVGLRRDYFLTRLNFEVTTAPNGELVISVTSREPVREPYLNFLVEVTWPSGRVMREYSVLVDPPVYAEESGEPAQVQQASTPQRSTQQAPASRQPARTATTGGRDAGVQTLGPVQASDTLWEIAQRVKPDNSVSTQQVMLAIQDLNPDAFINGNINRLKRGEVLRVPDMDDIRARSQAQANREVAAQNRAFAQPQPQVDATRTAGATGDAGAAQQAAPDELRLVVPEDGDEARTEGSAGGDGRQGGTADAGEAVALEELDRVQRENEELNSRVEDLQDQVETLQRLIELKDTQLAEIQQGMAAGDEPAEGTGEAPAQAAPTTGEAATDPAMTMEEGASEAADGTTAQGEQADAQAPDAGMPDEGAEGADGDTSPVMTDEDFTDVEDTGATQAEPEQQPAEPAVQAPAGQEQPEAEPQQPAPPAQDMGFLATAIDLIAGNFLYQIALGGFLVLLLLIVLLISRRRASNDNDFYQQLDEGDEGDDGFELTLGEEDAAATASVLEEADRYVSYGQHDAAAEVLENAISREPSRSDLRLKLLAVYADTGNRAAFDKQYSELEAMELDEAMPEAEALRARLEDVESTPSIDELESQLRGGESFGAAPQEQPEDDASDIASTPVDDETSELMASFEELDLPEEEDEQPAGEDRDEAIEFDFSSLDTSDSAEAAEDTPDRATEEPRDEAATQEDDFGGIDFELPEESATDEDGAGSEQPPEEAPLDLEDDFSSLELDDAGIDSEPAAEDVEGAAEPAEEDNLDFGDLELDTDEPEPVDESANPEDEADLDESFLDELDAELDKVTSGDRTDDDGLEDLELDVSDEDLELMDEASEAEPEDESQLDLGDLDLDEPEPATEAGGENPAGDDLSDLEIPELEDDSIAEPEDVSPADQAPKVDGASSIDEIDEASLGDEDDFDFLSGTDEVATKLDLARAYVDMGDSEGAREILEEVILEGNEEQKSDAQSLLKKLP